MTPANVEVGGTVTFSGTGCPPADAAFGGFGAGDAFNGTNAYTTPRADGSWTVTVTVGDQTALGNIEAKASCVDAVQHGEIFPYVPFAIHVGSFRQLHVTPSMFVHPGTTLTITPTAACPQGAPAGIDVRLQTSDLNYSEVPYGNSEVTSDFSGLDAAGNWSQDLLVPADTRPGNYFVNARCYGPSRSINAWYETAAVTVLAADVAIPQPTTAPTGRTGIPITR